MSGPLLVLDHDWHSQRARLRGGRSRPPPLVAAGIDLGFEPDSGRTVKLGGLAVIFGIFPASADEFIGLAKARLNLGPDQARELDPVLNTRILAMWAWLPTKRQDCYLEYDRATGEAHLWLVGPSAGEMGACDLALQGPEVDRAFLDALVLNGPSHWGGSQGLARLVNRHGHQALLVAAQVADHLEHHPRQPRAALALANARWSELDTEDEGAWAGIAGNEHPWVCVQLGRLALRLGLLRAARLLLMATGGTGDAAPIAWFDLGQACEALEDLPAAETAFARFAAARPGDPDAWRRLLFCRLRMQNLHIADETLRRYRGASGRDDDLAERFLAVVARSRLRGEERALLAGWLGARLHDALIALAAGAGEAERMPGAPAALDALVEEIARSCFAADDGAFLAAVGSARADLLARIATHNRRAPRRIADGHEPRAAAAAAPDSAAAAPAPRPESPEPAAAPEPDAQAEALADALLRVALLALPFLGPRPRDGLDSGAVGDHLVAALTLWSTLRLGGGLGLQPRPAWIAELAVLAAGRP
jgi:hypothetical protein